MVIVTKILDLFFFSSIIILDFFFFLYNSVKPLKVFSPRLLFTVD